MITPTEKVDASIFFDEVEIGPHETRPVKARIPEKISAFRGQELIVWESDAGATEIARFAVDDVVSLDGPVPSITYSENSIMHDISTGTILRSSSVTLNVHNETDKPVKWRAEIRGKAVL